MSDRRSRSHSLAHLWLRWYTAGLGPPLCKERRAEIESDLAEHARCREAEGWTGPRLARERLFRTLLGVPADLRWRRDVVTFPRLEHTARPFGGLAAWVRWEWPTLAGLALGAFYLIFALYVFGLDVLQEAPVLRLFEVGEVDGRPIGGTIVLLLGLVTIAASGARLLVSNTAGVTLVCAALPALPFFWMVVPTLFGVVVIAGASIDLARQGKSATSTNRA